MREYVLTLLVAAAVTYVLTPLVRRFAIAVGAMHAARDRDVHVVPTPLLGGFAMYAGLAAGLVVASQLPSLNSVFADTNMAKGLLLAGGLVVVMGFVDDRWGMGVISKLAGQVAAGVILVWSGAEVTWLPAPHGTTLGLTSDQQIAVTILVVVITINAVNFIDGLDGLAAGIGLISAGASGMFAIGLVQRVGNDPSAYSPALLSAVLAGACLGFLPHNFNPARIFMGDSGSMLIGLMLAAATTSESGRLFINGDDTGGGSDLLALFAPVVVLLAVVFVPLLDLLMAVIRRTRKGLSPFSPDKMHLHHRLLEIGHSHRRAVLLIYLWAAVLAFGAVALALIDDPFVVLWSVGVGLVVAVLATAVPRARQPRPTDRRTTKGSSGNRAPGAG